MEKDVKKTEIINEFLSDLENKELKDCIEAKKYIRRFGFNDVVNYLQGREDCLKELIERNYKHEWFPYAPLVNMKRFYKFFSDNTPPVLRSILNDTLKVDGKWSRTSLTMFTAWIASLHMAYYDLYKNGFHMEVFLTLVGVALGSKVTDSISKKINPTQSNNAPAAPEPPAQEQEADPVP